MTLAALAFEAGDWETARSAPRPPTASLVGVMLIFALLVDAESRWVEGDDQLAAAAWRPPHRWSGSAARRSGTAATGRCSVSCSVASASSMRPAATVAQALDEFEVCTDDVMRIARVTTVGLGVEADRALRPRT